MGGQLRERNYRIPFPNHQLELTTDMRPIHTCSKAISVFAVMLFALAGCNKAGGDEKFIGVWAQKLGSNVTIAKKSNNEYELSGTIQQIDAKQRKYVPVTLRTSGHINNGVLELESGAKLTPNDQGNLVDQGGEQLKRVK